MGSCPAMEREEDRRIAHRTRERSRLIERGGERDDAPARAAAIGRLDADRAGESRGLPDRAAGVGRRSRRGRGAPPPPPPSRPTSRPAPARCCCPAAAKARSTGPKHEVSFDEPMANSSLLSLPSITAPSRQRLAVTVEFVVRHELAKDVRAAVVRTSLVANMSLTPSGMPSSGRASARPSARPPLAPWRAPAGASPAHKH